MFSKLFMRKNKSLETNILDKINITSENIFEKIFVYTPVDNGIEYPFPTSYNTSNISLELDKFMSIAERIYKSSYAGNSIDKIIVTNLNSDLGHCIPEISNNELKIKIKIDSFQMGIVNHSGYICEYSDEIRKKFTNTLAHELYHAEYEKRIVDAFGIEEYKKITNNKLTKFAKIISSEYFACRKNAAEYNDFEFNININNIIDGSKFLIPVIFIEDLEKYEEQSFNYAIRLNYALATRCAHADVSQEKEEYLYIYPNTYYQKQYKKYINNIRKLLNDNYKNHPLNYENYLELGTAIIRELAAVYKV